MFISKGQRQERISEPVPSSVAEWIANKARVPRPRRASFARLIDALIESTTLAWHRRTATSHAEIYSGPIVEHLKRVEATARELANLLDPDPGASGAKREVQVASALLHASIPGLHELRERIEQVHDQAASLSMRVGIKQTGASLCTLQSSFRRKGRPRGTGGAPLLDFFIEQLRVLVRQHGGRDLTASGPGGDYPAGRETWGTLEPVVIALKPYLPVGFLPNAWADRARRHLVKK